MIEEIQRIMHQHENKVAVHKPFPSLFDKDAPERFAELEAEENKRPPLVISGAPVSELRLPYKWGKFQGWSSLAVGLFAASFTIYSIVSNGLVDERLTDVAIVSPLLVLSGYAFALRKKFSVAMTYVWMGFIGILFFVTVAVALWNDNLAASEKSGIVGTACGQFITGLLFWVVCNKYYRKRRLEFT